MKILVIRFSSIGDIILTSPVLRCLKNQIEDCEIHFLTKEKFGSLVRPNQHVKKVYTFSENLNDCLSLLKSENYDAVIDLHNNLRSSRVKWSLGCKSYTFQKLNIRKWLLVKLKLNVMPDKHVVHRYLDTCKNLGVTYDGKGLDFYVNETETEMLPVELPQNYNVLVIGGTYATKRLPTDKLLELIDGVKGNLVILGDKADAQRLGGFPPRANVFNLAGQLSLNQCATVLQKANVVATHDTGLMHMAAAFDRSVLSIWGNTVPQFGMYPFFADGSLNGKNTNFEVTGLSCRPCSKLGYNRCPKGHFRCMNNQDIQQIIEKLD